MQNLWQDLISSERLIYFLIECGSNVACYHFLPTITCETIVLRKVRFRFSVCLLDTFVQGEIELSERLTCDSILVLGSDRFEQINTMADPQESCYWWNNSWNVMITRRSWILKEFWNTEKLKNISIIILLKRFWLIFNICLNLFYFCLIYLLQRKLIQHWQIFLEAD